MSEDEVSLPTLHVAARKRSVTTIQCLLDNPEFKVNCRSRTGLTPLIVAAREGSLQVCELLVQNGACVNLADDEETTALHEAAGNHHVQICRFLMDQGANVMKRTRTGNTVLHVAARSGNIAIARMLLERGVDLDSKNSASKTPLDLSVKHDCEEMNIFLTGARNDVHIVSANGTREDVQRVLTDVNKRNSHNETPLIVATRAGNLEVCRLLLGYDACEINAQDTDGKAALHQAASTGSVDICRILLGHRAEVDVRTTTQDTPLHFASLSGFLELARLLLDHEADPQAKNDAGKTPASLALMKNHMQMYRFLMEHLETSHGIVRIDGQIPAGSDNLYVSRYVSEFNHESLVGYGSYGVVLKAEHKLALADYALKRVTLPEDKKFRDIILREIRALAKLQHDNIIQFHNAWEENPSAWRQTEWDAIYLTRDSRPTAEETAISSEYFTARLPVVGPTVNLLYMQLELCREETLGHILDRGQHLDKHVTLTYFHQIVSAVSYIHTRGIIHRDLKPHNIFFAMSPEDKIKIGDFGLSTALDVARREGMPMDISYDQTTNVGTKLYMSPEQLEEKEYGPKSDVFPLGLILFEMIRPFGPDSRERRTQVFLSLRSEGQCPADFKRLYPDEAKLIANMIVHNPMSRLASLNLRSQVKELLNRGMMKADQKHFLDACEDGRLEVVQTYVKGRVDRLVRVKDRDGWSGLHLAAMQGRHHVVDYLIQEKWPDVDQRREDGITPLHLASSNGHLLTCSRLVLAEASLEAVDRAGDQPIHRASKEGHVSVVELLIQKGSDIQANGEKNRSPLHVASYAGHLDLVKLLVDKGADLRATDGEGKTPLDVARLKGRTQVAMFLKECRGSSGSGRSSPDPPKKYLWWCTIL